MAEWKIKGIFKGDADRVYDEIKTLPAVTPKAVLEKAKDKKSELNKCFTWNNDEAAEKYRLIEARRIIQLLVVSPRDSEDAQPVRIFQISSEKNQYQENEYFMRNEDEYQVLLKRAKSELHAFQQRYSMLSELEEILSLIDKI